MESELFGKLISSIYQASTSEIAWDNVLDELADVTGARVASIALHDFALKEAWLFGTRTDPDIMDSYAQYYWKQNILVQLTRRVAPGIVMTPKESVDATALEETEFYRDWWLPQEIGLGVMTANLVAGEDLHSMINVGRLRSDGFFGSEEKALFAEIIPHMIRGLDIYRRLQISASKPDFSSGSAMPVGLVIVDRAGRILDAGEHTLALLKSCGLLAHRQSHTAIATGDGKLEAMIRSCESAEPGKPCGGVVMANSADGGHVKISVSPCPDECHGHPIMAGQSPSAFLLVSTRASDPSHLSDLLQELYGLTPAEVSVALEVAKGKGRQSVAEHLGLQVGTVRTHLASVFAKIGVNRQAELARLIAELE